MRIALVLCALGALTACGAGGETNADQTYGSTVGTIANNFSTLDCVDQRVQLHALSGKHRAVMIVMAKDTSCEDCLAHSAGYLAEVTAVERDVHVLEVLHADDAAQAPQSEAACRSWTERVAAQHQVVRDTLGPDSVDAELAMAPLETIVTDRLLRIVYRGPSQNTRLTDDVLDRLKETDGQY